MYVTEIVSCLLSLQNAGKDKLSVNSLSRILPDRATNAVNKKIIPVKEIGK